MNVRPSRKIVAIIPCFNEEAGIADVLDSFPYERIEDQGFELSVLVIDNNSSDRTALVAKERGALVIHEPRKGKGNAIRRGFYAVPDDTDYVVMLDGDGTYRPEEILRLIELLESDFCDVAIGSRLGGKITKNSMRLMNRAGNWFFSHIVRQMYRVNVTDVLTGYFAWKRDALVRLRPHLCSEGFAIEMEMVTKMAKLGESIYCVPITYAEREGESSLRPFYDGSRILWMFTKNLFWKPRPQKMEKIVFVSDTVMPYMKGGKERRLYEVARRLVKEGREVHIYTMNWWHGQKTKIHDGVVYHALCDLYPLYSEGHRSIKQGIIFGLATLKLLFVRYDVLDVDHIPFFPLISARAVTWVHRKKLFATWHEVWGGAYWRTYLRGLSGRIGYLIESLCLLLPDVIIANSTHTEARLREVRTRAEIETVTLGADLDLIYKAEPAIETSDVIYVGRLLSHKGVSMLIDAISLVKEKYPAIKTLIIGPGPEKEALLKQIASLGLTGNVTMIDSVEDHTLLYGFMKSSRMLVLPSSREGFGLVVVEAHAAGIPVITSSHPDNAAKSLIKDGVNGYVANLTAPAFAEKIEQLLDTTAHMDPRYAIEQYDWRSVVLSLEKVFALAWKK